MSPKAKSVADKLLAKGAKVALVDTWSAMMFRRAAKA
jgi:hypothetical protein